MTMGNPALISLKDISKNFGKKQVLRDINIAVCKGEIMGIVGESGIGKTTLLNMIIGFIKPDKGRILFNLWDNQGRSNHFRNFGFSTQGKSFYSGLTAKENLIYFASLHDIPRITLDKKINLVLKKVRLDGEEDTLAKNFSHGMQKRLDIACSIIHDPDILIFDEPTADLDAGLRNQIWSLIKELNNKRKKTIIVSSHLPEELSKVCSKIYALQDKKLRKAVQK